MGGEQKFKEGDRLLETLSGTNREEVIFFTNMQQAYKAKLYEFDDSKASVLGDYLPQKLGMAENEIPIAMALPKGYDGNLIFVFENGKISKIEVKAYDTKSNRKRLTGAFSDKSPLCAIIHMAHDGEIALYTQSRMLIFDTSLIQAKTTRTAQGSAALALKKGQKVICAMTLDKAEIKNPSRYRVKTLPAAGAIIKEEDSLNRQISLE